MQPSSQPCRRFGGSARSSVYLGSSMPSGHRVRHPRRMQLVHGHDREHCKPNKKKGMSRCDDSSIGPPHLQFEAEAFLAAFWSVLPRLRLPRRFWGALRLVHLGEGRKTTRVDLSRCAKALSQLPVLPGTSGPATAKGALSFSGAGL